MMMMTTFVNGNLYRKRNLYHKFPLTGTCYHALVSNYPIEWRLSERRFKTKMNCSQNKTRMGDRSRPFIRRGRHSLHWSLAALQLAELCP